MARLPLRVPFVLLSLVAFGVASGCVSSHPREVPGPDGSTGICCPIDDVEGCVPPATRLGGWAPNVDACPTGTNGIPSFVRVEDAQGCPALVPGPGSCGADAGVTCDTVGCGAPPTCGEGCSDPCGCCACQEGEAFCLGSGGLRRCVGGCFEVVDCDGECVDEGGGDASCGGVCEAIAAEYTALVSENTCDEDTDCRLLAGHCGVGLGGCFHVTSGPTQEDLNALETRWLDAECVAGVCDCAPPPTDVACIDGSCQAAP